MGETATCPTEAPGHWGLQINPVPASFINFFSGRDAATPFSIAWADHFAVQPQITRPPAWCRVAVEAHSSFRRAGLIMKRISLPRFRALGQSLPAAAAPAKPVEQEEEEEEEGEAEEEARRIRPRLSTFTPTIADISMHGKAPSHAEIVSGLMKAKAAVANHYYTHISSISAEENQQSRENRYFKYVPRKRLLGDDDNDESSIERDALTNRNRLRTYAELANILSRAAETGAAEIDLTVASSAEASAALLQSGRDPRVHLAAQGVPDLSVIADATEVADSPSVLPKLLGAMSPVKRLSGQSSPIRTPTRRLTDSLVQLLPGSSPMASPSPTKSSSPSTPLKTSSQAKRPASSPAGFPRSPVTMQSPAHQREQPGSPTFSSPRGSKNATPSSLHSRRAASIRDTPTKQRLRPATTPSRRNTLDFSSPYQMFSPRAATPSQTESPLGLVASLPRQYQSVTSPATQVVVGDVANINFGPSSPSFTHASWLKPPVNAGEIQRCKNVSNALRRRSEPLARSLHKAKIRKRSMSPQKTTHEGAESPAKDFSDSTMTIASDDPDNSIVADGIPAAAVTTATATNPVTTVTTPVVTPRKVRGVVDVDMRKNLDIFAHKASPRINGKPAMEELARIAGSRCDGGANVLVFQEKGRLVVRFKLPTEYASMFPESQGADESQFSSSPDVSASPRLGMKNSSDVAGTPTDQQSPVTVSHSSPALHSSPCKGDRTIPVSDFDLSSPVVKAAHSPSFALRSSAKRTAALRAFATSPASFASPFADSTCMSFPDAIIDDDDTTIPGMRSPTQLDLTDAAQRLEGFSSPTKSKPIPLVDDVEMAVGETRATSGDNSISSRESGTESASTPSNDDGEKGNTARSKRARISSPSATQKQTTCDATYPSNTDADVTSSKPADESPGREYMREFIKRSKPKALAPTTTSSTAAKPRLPLEAKSPNAESVQRPKRKLDEEDVESGKLEDGAAAKGKASSQAKASEAMPLKEKQSVDLAALTTTTQDASDEEADKDGEHENENADDGDEIEADPDADELGAECANGPATRRSSRLRGKSSTAGKSSIPTPVRVRRGKAVLSSIRNEQQDLTRQTLANTRRNKGKALSAKRALAKLSVEEHEQPQQPEDGEHKASESSGAAKGGKSVVWKEPLAAYGESKGETQADEGLKERPKRGRGAPKATTSTTTTNTGRRGGTGRVAKPTPKAGAGPAKQRSAKSAAAAPKRGGTGTPARMTRSRARD